MELKKHCLPVLTQLVVLCFMLGMASCVSYLPPSSLHVDMVPNRHVIIRDSLAKEAHAVDVQAYVHQGMYHHKRDPEIEDNKGITGQIGYSFAEPKHSVAISAAYSLGNMIDNDKNRYRYSNLMLRSSFSIDEHDGRWHYHLVKLQVAASKGFGAYQRYLASGASQRDRYNQAILPDSWYYSIGIGSAMYHYNQAGHRTGMFFGFARGTDFDTDGFRSDHLNLQVEHLRASGIGLQLGGMLDARFSPGGETVYVGLSYGLWRKER